MDIEKHIFCADPNICAIIAKRNSKDKWQLWGLSEILETGEAIYETRLLCHQENDIELHNEYDAVEPINTTSRHIHIKLLQGNNWHKVKLIEQEKTIGKAIDIVWRTSYFKDKKKPPLLELFFDF